MSQGQISEDYPEDGWLKGYFNDNESDVIDGKREVTKWRKNVDFLRLRDVALHLLDPSEGKTVLDIGCASGETMIYCGMQGATVYGKDLDEKAVAQANSQLKRFGINGEAICGDATTMDFPDNHFDCAISSDFMEHVTDETKVKIFREVLRVVKPGGSVVTKTPNLSYLTMSLRYKQLRGLLKFKNPANFAIAHTPGTDDPQHIGLATRATLSQCLEEAGFLNYQFYYAPLRRFGKSKIFELISTEIPLMRDYFCEDLFCRAYKPIVMSHFPD